MAKLIASAASAPAPAQANAQEEASDLTVLHPERELQLGGEAVTVREYGNLEWLRVLVRAEPLVAAVTEMLAGADTPTYEQALAVIADNADALMPLVAQAVDRDVQWIDQLPSGDVEVLLMTWWAVNAHFFVSRAINRVLVARGEQQAREDAANRLRSSSPLSGARSTPPSSPTATAAASLAATQSAS